MNNIEFSNQFDVLWNNINSNQAPGLNEYEKSVFLTKAQDEVLKNYFNPKSNPKQDGYDDTIKRQADFSGLMREEPATIEQSPSSQFDPRSIVYKVPTDVYLTINEQILLKDKTNNKVKGIRQVLPINYEEYRRVMSKPYKEPLKYQAWRLFTSTESNSFNGQRIAEIIMTSTDKNSDYNKEYRIRYIKFPKPIILSDFSEAFGENISINGYDGSEDNYSESDLIENWDTATQERKNAYLLRHNNVSPTSTTVWTVWDPCELDPVIHEEILQRAVELAKVAWAGDANLTIQTGQRSE